MSAPLRDWKRVSNGEDQTSILHFPRQPWPGRSGPGHLSGFGFAELQGLWAMPAAKRGKWEVGFFISTSNGRGLAGGEYSYLPTFYDTREDAEAALVEAAVARGYFDGIDIPGCST